MELHLVDATYELFRAHFAPRPPVLGRDGVNLSGVSGLCDQLLYLLREEGATHVGCATDRVIESFRNDLFPGYKSSAGMPPELLAQFPIAEAAVEALGHRPVADGRVRGRRRDRAPRPVRFAEDRGSSGSSSARRTRTWRSSCATTGSCCGTAGADITYDDAGVRAKWGVAADIDPGLARARRRRVGRLSRGCPAGAPSRRPRSSAGTATSRTSRRRRRRWEVPGVGGTRAIALAATLRDHWDEALLYRDLARLRTVEDGVPIRQQRRRRAALGRRAARRLGGVLRRVGARAAAAPPAPLAERDLTVVPAVVQPATDRPLGRQ